MSVFVRFFCVKIRMKKCIEQSGRICRAVFIFLSEQIIIYIWVDIMINFYKTKRWENKRKNILKRDKYMCRECARYGKTTEANTVHHIIPIELRPDLKLDNRNLISLCEGCHNQMHDRNTGELTEKGRRWVERISPLLEKNK